MRCGTTLQMHLQRCICSGVPRRAGCAGWVATYQGGSAWTVQVPVIWSNEGTAVSDPNYRIEAWVKAYADFLELPEAVARRGDGTFRVEVTSHNYPKVSGTKMQDRYKTIFAGNNLGTGSFW